MSYIRGGKAPAFDLDAIATQLSARWYNKPFGFFGLDNNGRHKPQLLEERSIVRSDQGNKLARYIRLNDQRGEVIVACFEQLAVEFETGLERWTYPAAFHSSPMVIATLDSDAEQLTHLGVTNVSRTGCDVHIAQVIAGDETATAHLFAMGRGY